MLNTAKALFGLGALSFAVGIFMGLSGGEIRGIPAESFARASNSLLLMAITLLLWPKSEPKQGS